MRALDLAQSEPWLITDAGLAEICQIASRTNDIDALVARTGRPLMNSRTVRMHDGVAVIPVTGPIFRYANLFVEISGATSTEILARDLRTALEDEAVRAIILDLNSPGGMASGINELANMVFEGRDQKTIIAYAGGNMQSAAYWIGSAAHEVVADRTAILGSIGAIMSVVDTTVRDSKAGVRTIDIVSSQSPDKRVDVAQDEGRAKIQKIVDDLAGVFVSQVARNRGTDVETVLERFGRGGSMVGQAAIEAGLADRIGSLEQVIAELSPANDPMRRFFNMAIQSKTTPKGAISVSNTDELRAALTGGHTAEEITIASVDVEKAKTEAVSAALADVETKHKLEIEAAAKKATETERARVVGLNKIAMQGFEKEINAAVESGATVEATAVKITELARTRGTNLPQQRADAPDAVSHAGAVDASGTKKSGWGAITQRFNKSAKK